MSKNRLSSRKRRAFKTIEVLVLLVVSFVLLEIVVRLLFVNVDLAVLTGREAVTRFRPMAAWAHLDAFSAFRPKPGEYSDGKTVNSLGFISTPELTVDKPPGTLRIAFLGASSTAGTGASWMNLPDEQTWPWKTAGMVSESTSINVEFLNAAAGGYTSFESYGRLWSRIRLFSPDVVIVYHGWNEMYYFDDADSIEAWRTLPDGSWSLFQPGRKVEYIAPHWMDPLLGWSQVLTRIRLQFTAEMEGEIGRQDGVLADSFDHRGLDIWRTNLQLIRSTCEVIGAELYVARQATLMVPDLPDEYRRRCRPQNHGFDYQAHLEAFEGIYEVIDLEIPSERIIHTTEISGRPECFFDHVHPTTTGCSEIARITAEAIMPTVREIEIGMTPSTGEEAAEDD